MKLLKATTNLELRFDEHTLTKISQYLLSFDKKRTIFKASVEWQFKLLPNQLDVHDNNSTDITQ